MSFEHKDGSGTIFKNKFKKADNHPDYRGSGKDMAGNDVDLALWIKKDKNGNGFFSFKMSEPYQKPEREPEQKEEFDDEIPF